MHIYARQFFLLMFLLQEVSLQNKNKHFVPKITKVKKKITKITRRPQNQFFCPVAKISWSGACCPEQAVRKTKSCRCIWKVYLTLTVCCLWVGWLLQEATGQRTLRTEPGSRHPIAARIWLTTGLAAIQISAAWLLPFPTFLFRKLQLEMSLCPLGKDQHTTRRNPAAILGRLKSPPCTFAGILDDVLLAAELDRRAICVHWNRQTRDAKLQRPEPDLDSRPVLSQREKRHVARHDCAKQTAEIRPRRENFV